MKITVFNTKYIKYLAFYLLSYFGIAIMVDFKFAFMFGDLNLKWLNFQNWSDKFQIMSATPAIVAGAKEIVVCTPAPNGKVNPLLLAAMHLCGIKTAFKIGGARFE